MLGSKEYSPELDRILGLCGIHVPLLVRILGFILSREWLVVYPVEYTVAFDETPFNSSLSAFRYH